jgi:ferritin
MEKAISGQVNNEMYSAYLYMSMSSYAQHIGLKGFANWFMVQYHEEMLHAMKMYEYIQRQGGQPALVAIKEPERTFKDALDMFEKTLEHEHFITKCIHDLVALARSEKDPATEIFLHWYVNEQIEEEENDNDIIAQLKLIREDVQGLLMLDRELAGRMTTVLTDYSKGIQGKMAAPAQP